MGAQRVLGEEEKRGGFDDDLVKFNYSLEFQIIKRRRSRRRVEVQQSLVSLFNFFEEFDIVV